MTERNLLLLNIQRTMLARLDSLSVLYEQDYYALLLGTKLWYYSFRDQVRSCGNYKFQKSIREAPAAGRGNRNDSLIKP